MLEKSRVVRIFKSEKVGFAYDLPTEFSHVGKIKGLELILVLIFMLAYSAFVPSYYQIYQPHFASCYPYHAHICHTWS